MLICYIDHQSLISFPTEHLSPGLAWHLTPHVMTHYSIYIRKKKVYSARSIGEEVWITWSDIECSSFTLPHQVQACTGHLPNVKTFVCTTHFVSKWFSRCMFDKFVIFFMDFMWHFQNEPCRKDPFLPTCDDSSPSLINFAKLDNMLMHICVIFNCKVMGIMRC